MIANDFDRVKFLVAKGADVNKADSQGWTPLQSAARQRQDNMIKLLIELGADVNRADDTGLRRSSSQRCATTFRRSRCCSRMARISRSLARRASGRCRSPSPKDKYEAAKALMEGGADVSAPLVPMA